MNEKLDIVYAWVDGSDEIWIKKKLIAQAELKNYSFDSFSTVNGRFRNSNEIIYSIRSLEKYFPEHGRIFIVTDNQKVSGLKDDMVTYVSHEEIIEKNKLPTYSSKKIESNLYKIKDLSANFLYFNDDILLGPAFKVEDFHYNGLTFMHFENPKESEDKFPPNLKLKSLREIEKLYPGYEKKNINRNFKHNPKLLNKYLFKEMINELYYEYNLLQSEVFRKLETLSLVSDTYFRWLHAKNKAVEKKVDYVYVNCRNQLEDFNDLINRYPTLSYFCINDVTDNNYNLDSKLNILQEVLSNIFPKKSKYEI